MRFLRMTVALVGMSMALTGSGSAERSRTSSSAERSTASAVASLEAVSRLEGTWQTELTFPRDVEATLRRHGLAKWIKRFRPLTPVPTATVLILHIRGGEWDLYGKRRGRPREEIDYDAGYTVYGSKVTVTHSDGYNVHRWSVKGDILTFRWLETTHPRYMGIPDEVFQRALYMTKPFKRQR